MNSTSRSYRLADLVKGLEVTIRGDENIEINGVCAIHQSRPGCLSFLSNPHYRQFLTDTTASAVVLSAEEAEKCNVTAIISRDPYYTYAKLASYFMTLPSAASGIHPSVVVGENSVIDPSATIAPHCVIGKRVTIGANAQIGAGTVIGDDVSIGAATIIDPRVTIYFGVKIGQRSRLASGVVIGSDGFGFAPFQGSWHKVPQLGGVEIGDDVDIGANTTIDRGAIEPTVIGNGTKLDNLIQVGHNVRIGTHNVIAGCVAIAGSVTIGNQCMIGGATCFAGHVTICDRVIITGMTAVTKSITEPGIYSSGIVGAVPNHEFRKNNARFHRLENLMQRVKNLETALKTPNERT